MRTQDTKHLTSSSVSSNRGLYFLIFYCLMVPPFLWNIYDTVSDYLKYRVIEVEEYDAVPYKNPDIAICTSWYRPYSPNALLFNELVDYGINSQLFSEIWPTSNSTRLSLKQLNKLKYRYRVLSSLTQMEVHCILILRVGPISNMNLVFRQLVKQYACYDVLFLA